MYNDFVLVGPKADPACVKGNDVFAAFGKLATRQGQRPSSRAATATGTHSAELRTWKEAGVEPRRREG